MIKIGEIVRLKSGGPSMTVSLENNDGTVYCIWFDNNEPKRSKFYTHTLVKVDSNII